MGARPRTDPRGHPRVLGDQRVPQARRPVARGALRVSSTWQDPSTRGRRRRPRRRAPSVCVSLADVRPPGQHIDLRLTAPDGYQAVRSYSAASANPPDTLDITVEERPTAKCHRTWCASWPPVTSSRSAGRWAAGSSGAPRKPPGPAHRRRLRNRAADGDAAPMTRSAIPPRSGCSTPYATPSRRYYRQELASLAESSRAPSRSTTCIPGARRQAGRSDASMPGSSHPALSAARPTLWSIFAGQQASSKPSRAGLSTPAIPRTGSRPNGMAAWEAPDERMDWPARARRPGAGDAAPADRTALGKTTSTATRSPVPFRKFS